MKKVLVLGGKLQGVEAAYLMKKAGWHVTIADRNARCPAAQLGDAFLQMNFMEDDRLETAMKEADFIIPALEKLYVLERIAKAAEECKVPIMFNLDSFRISHSKLRSDRLFAKIGVPAPKPWPECGLPVIIKPSGRSGSEGVRLMSTEEELQKWKQAALTRADWVVQEYLSGPSYSIEIIAKKGEMKTFQVTELEMDRRHDCKRVLCPSLLPREKELEFTEIAGQLAAAVELDGIMDVEVILNKNQLKVLEIDARLPSQTLTAVYNSTGVNAPAVYADGLPPGEMAMFTQSEGVGVIYEHIEVRGRRLRTAGEHIMGGHGPLSLVENFFGADEAITNYKPGKNSWVATLIMKDTDRKAVWAKHERVIKNIMEANGLWDYDDYGLEEM
ncbi:MAG: 3-methylornithine--L-lysine ligase PylC [Selenomonadaceae bacterium]|nr:3-methylornithine--L-lysine ligase PylC [Selenomonadaceae bacterium]